MSTPCSKHPGFKGLRLGKKALECPDCVAYYKARKEAGEKESRSRSKKVVVDGQEVEITKEEVEEALAALSVEGTLDESSTERADESATTDETPVSLDDIQDLL